MVEVGLISDFMLALSNATVSASVLITGMLVFSGLGAYASERLLPRARNLMPKIFIAIGALLIGYGFFLDRVLDLIGTLPTAEEARTFLADKNPAKRSQKIEDLLGRPEYALFWATKFSDLTGNDDRLTPQPRSKTSWLWYDWLKDKLQKNVPYDELVAGIVTATTREGREVDVVLAEHKKVMDALATGFDEGTYAQRKTNDVFWKKAGNRGDQVFKVEPADFSSDDLVFQIGIAPSRIDILTDIGPLTFEEAWQNRITIELEDLRVPVIGRADLIRAKRDAGRPRDLADVAELEGR